MNSSKSFTTLKLLVTLCFFALTSSFGFVSGNSTPNILLCVADDHSYPHASAYGSELVNTPGFDRVARSGVLFHRAFASAPSCSPSRASILSGRPFFLTGSAAMNHAVWPEELVPFPSLLKDAGYRVGFTGKRVGARVSTPEKTSIMLLVTSTTKLSTTLLAPI